MRNRNDEDDDYDYSPNELAILSIKNPDKYREVVNSNLDDDETVEDWEQGNLEWNQKQLAEQRFNIGRRT